MRIVLAAGAVPRLEGASDFKHFSLMLDPALDADRQAAVASVAELDDADHAWVRPDTVRAMSPLGDRAEWEEGFAAMVSFAAKHGWVDAEGRIRAHIEVAGTPPAVGADAFRHAMRRFASGVCVVAAGEGDARCGMTVSAFTSVSADPPMVLVCLNRGSSAHACLTGASTYSINILGATQKDVALLFAGQKGAHGADRFDEEWREGIENAPILTTAHHSVVCARHAQYEVASHTVLIGRVIETIVGQGDAALVNYEGVLGPSVRAA
ncbi:flavin reductase family protein [Amorphus sp. 3PC139-8]|uniref:flavin reductase family protein n=1 Tax=Amorphus sp. 3PC139-8 TaxID=2735676 RepID=UPI00345D8BFD